MKIGLREIHSFIVTKLPPVILRRYKNFEILNESDLQFEVRRELVRFLRKDGEKGRLTIHGCFFCSDSKSGSKTYPDILIMHRSKPWVLIELKEAGTVKQLTAQQERNKLHAQRRTVKAKRGYLLYVGRRGKGLLLKGRKGRYGYWFFEVPAVLENEGMNRDEIKQFKKEFHKRRKFVSHH